jgi:hypothetical protein
MADPSVFKQRRLFPQIHSHPQNVQEVSSGASLMLAISGALVLIAVAAAACKFLWLARVSHRRLKQPAEFAEVSQKLNKQDP